MVEHNGVTWSRLNSMLEYAYRREWEQYSETLTAVEVEETVSFHILLNRNRTRIKLLGSTWFLLEVQFGEKQCLATHHKV